MRGKKGRKKEGRGKRKYANWVTVLCLFVVGWLVDNEGWGRRKKKEKRKKNEGNGSPRRKSSVRKIKKQKRMMMMMPCKKAKKGNSKSCFSLCR